MCHCFRGWREEKSISCSFCCITIWCASVWVVKLKKGLNIKLILSHCIFGTFGLHKKQTKKKKKKKINWYFLSVPQHHASSHDFPAHTSLSMSWAWRGHMTQFCIEAGSKRQIHVYIGRANKWKSVSTEWRKLKDYTYAFEYTLCTVQKLIERLHCSLYISNSSSYITKSNKL